ncbi:MAG: hypothetical protein D6729_15275 [Deltaproteobacteria bacterium]|nr:MAG: hypothetical protein D6729_15275 [Deltaproteobacteria bacterium]
MLQRRPALAPLAAALAILVGLALGACAGVEAPFVEVTPLSDTRDPLGPYTVRAVATDDREIASVRLYHRSDAVADAAVVTLEATGEGIYEGTLPGYPPGTLVHYFVEAIDTDGNAAYDPPTARDGDAGCVETSAEPAAEQDGASYCFRVLR